jgi:hypothetical protein
MTKQALVGTTRNLRTLSDGTVRIQVDIEPNDALAAMQFFGSPNTPIAMACLNAEAIAEHQQNNEIDREAGLMANSLHRVGFFKKREVAQAIGPDKDFLVWVRKQPCVITGATQDIEAAHVRRVAAGAGTAIKPEYNAIPLHRDVHREQHQKGEVGCLQKFCPEFEWNEKSARDFFDKQADRLREQWVKNRLYIRFNVQSMKDVNYKEFAQWACDNNLKEHLSQIVRELM